MVSARDLTDKEKDWYTQAFLATGATRAEVFAKLSKEVTEAGGVVFLRGETIMIASPSLAKLKAKERRLSGYEAVPKLFSSGSPMKKFGDLPKELQEIVTDLTSQIKKPEGKTFIPEQGTAVLFGAGFQCRLTDGDKVIDFVRSPADHSEHSNQLAAAPLAFDTRNPSPEEQALRDDSINGDRLIGPKMQLSIIGRNRAGQAKSFADFWEEFAKWEADFETKTAAARRLAIQAAAIASGAPDWMKEDHQGKRISELPPEMKAELEAWVKKRMSLYGLKNDAEVNAFLSRATVSSQLPRVTVTYGLPKPYGAAGAGF
ncbi:MAG: hypothetical protein HONBIEJF_01689 [Fimbriimonadaceae bacterium]|nr:hypothetical protein [Fimbriimonadaceae bacterium]